MYKRQPSIQLPLLTPSKPATIDLSRPAPDPQVGAARPIQHESASGSISPIDSITKQNYLDDLQYNPNFSKSEGCLLCKNKTAGKSFTHYKKHVQTHKHLHVAAYAKNESCPICESDKPFNSGMSVSKKTAAVDLCGTLESDLHCDLCGIDFTNPIELEVHQTLSLIHI